MAGWQLVHSTMLTGFARSRAHDDANDPRYPHGALAWVRGVRVMLQPC